MSGRMDQMRVLARTTLVNLPWVPLAVYNAALWLALVRDRRRFFPTADVAGLDVLERHWSEIRTELDALDTAAAPAFSDVDRGQERFAGDGRWRTWSFLLYGRAIPVGRASCPRTAELLDEIPGLFTAMFSVLDEGKRLPTHLGTYKGVLRGQLALRVPPGDGAGLWIAGQEYRWREGEAVVFDDNWPHRAWNDGPGDRVVLFLDIERPLPWPWLRRLNRWVMGRLRASRRVARAAEAAEEIQRALAGPVTMEQPTAGTGPAAP